MRSNKGLLRTLDAIEQGQLVAGVTTAHCCLDDGGTLFFQISTMCVSDCTCTVCQQVPNWCALRILGILKHTKNSLHLTNEAQKRKLEQILSAETAARQTLEDAAANFMLTDINGNSPDRPMVCD